VVWFIIPCCSITVLDQCAYMLQSVAPVRRSAHLDTYVVSMVLPVWGASARENCVFWASSCFALGHLQR
jgi:hypothetical protein